MNVKNAVTVKIARTILQTRKNSPALMFGVGMVAMAGTVVLACKATLQLEEILKEAEYRDDEPNIKLRTGIKIAELYGPAVGVGVISVVCLTGSHVVLTKRNATLTAAYAALNKVYNDYRDRVRTEFGDETERTLAFDIKEKDIERDPKNGKAIALKGSIPGAPSQYARFFDETADNWSRSPGYNKAFLTCQQAYANTLLNSKGHVFLNEIYDALGIPRSPAGAIVGWVLGKDGDHYVDFGLHNQDDEMVRAFNAGWEKSILLDFNVDGIIYDLI